MASLCTLAVSCSCLTHRFKEGCINEGSPPSLVCVEANMRVTACSDCLETHANSHSIHLKLQIRLWYDTTEALHTLGLARFDVSMQETLEQILQICMEYIYDLQRGYSSSASSFNLIWWSAAFLKNSGQAQVMVNISALILWLGAADTTTDTDLSLISEETAEWTLSSCCILYKHMPYRCHIPPQTHTPYWISTQQYGTCYVYDRLITVGDELPHLWIL